MDGFKRFVKKALLTHQAWTAFFLCALIGFLVRKLSDNPYVCIIYCDVKSYLDLSESFVQGGCFSFLNFPDSVRGYFFPFLLYGIHTLWSLIRVKYESATAFSAIAFSSLLFAVILPNMFMKRKTYLTLLWRIIPYVLLLFFWSDLLFYPLSDFWAFGFCVIAAYLFCRLGARAMESKMESGRKIWLTLLLSVGAGALLYMSYNTRTIYLYAGAPLVLAFAVMNRKAGIRNILTTLIGCCIGFFLIAAPQMAINQQHLGKATLEVVTDAYWEEKQSLNVSQLDGGIYLQRYDTFVSDNKASTMPYIDAAGSAMLKQEGLTESSESVPYGELHLETMSQYISLVFRYPLTFFGIYARHAINMMLMAYRQVYVTDLRPDVLSILLNYAILFICGLGLWRRCAAAGVKQTLFGSQAKVYMLALLVPCAMLLASAVETRFFMPAYVACYCYCAYSLFNREMLEYVKKHWAAVLLLFVCILAALCGVWGNTLMALSAKPLL